MICIPLTIVARRGACRLCRQKNKKVVASRDAKSHSPQENLWFLLRKTNEKAALAGDDSSSSVKMVPRKGLEPSRVASLAPKASVSTNSTTAA